MVGIRKPGPIISDSIGCYVLPNTRGPIGVTPGSGSNPLSMLAMRPVELVWSGIPFEPVSLAFCTPIPRLVIRRQFSRQRQQALGPVEFAHRYRNTRVSYIDPQSGLAKSVSVDVHIYNNHGLPNRRANMQEKSALVRLVRRELRQAGGLGLIDVESQHRIQIAKSFYGKGSPEDFVVTLIHALRYGRDTPNHLQQYCDMTAKLGVDCSGFVNAYFMEIGKITEHKTISTYASGTLRLRPEDIQAGDVLTWHPSNGHIAVVDHVVANSNPVKMVVVESAGSKLLDPTTGRKEDGLGSSEYTVISVNNMIFRVDRGNRDGGVDQVKIAAV